MNQDLLRTVPWTMLAIALLLRQTMGAGQALPEVTLQSRASEIAVMFSDHPEHFEQTFAPAFLQAVPPEHLSGILREVFAKAGRCESQTVTKSTGPFDGEYVFGFEKGFSSRVQISIDPAAPHLVIGFWIGPVLPKADTIEALISRFKDLPGESSLFAALLSSKGLDPIAQYNSDKPLAIGSAFKLYVLSELLREVEAGKRHWTDVIPLDEASRSLPGGFLRDWPAGAPLTLYTLAGLMISQSDNTATDRLIHLLGREKVQSVLAVAGQKDPQRNIPFLTTLEMFKLKGDASGGLMSAYLPADAADRQTLLDTRVAAFSRDKIDYPAAPNHIDEVEWFASTSDLGRVMRWLQPHVADDGGDPAPRQILSINPGLSLPKEHWKFIGYKGGSEHGVLNLTYLLQDKDDRWMTLSATWNNPQHVVDEPEFLGLVQRAIELAEN